MAEMQEKVLADAETKHQLGAQIVQWEENLERLHCEQFRLRCYMASLQSGELPNPKVSYKSTYSRGYVTRATHWPEVYIYTYAIWTRS